MHEVAPNRHHARKILTGALTLATAAGFSSAVSAAPFTAGDIVISVYGNGSNTGVYGDNQAAPITLQELTPTGSLVQSIELPQVASGANYAISGEYGSSSEGSLSLSADGHSLVIAGYAVNANTYNAGETGSNNVYGNAALAQSTSLSNSTTAVPVARAIADIAANGTVDTSTALLNVFNTNNPRSVATVNGSSFYIAGQGVSGDTTQGVFLAKDGASTATAIYNGTDTRTAQIVNGQLYVSTDSKQPKNPSPTPNGSANIAVYGAALPTATTTPTILKGISNSVTLTAAQANTINSAQVGKTTYLSPEGFFFANATTLYVADGGNPKEDTVGAGKTPTGAADGGLQKWTFNGTTWVLDYTLSAGLNLVADTATNGTSGLIGLTGEVIGNSVELFATNATLSDLDQTYLYSITDLLSATTAPTGESFAVLDTAAPDTLIRGIAFAPTAAAVPEPASFALLGAGLFGISLIRRRKAR